MSDASPAFPDPTSADPLRIEHVHPRLHVTEETLRRRIRRVVEAEQASLDALVVVLTDHEAVLELNRKHLEHDYYTDVLAFSLGASTDRINGEIYVDLDTAHERHDEFEAAFENEVHRYVVHGLLHLIGYDDHTDDGQAAMRRRENHYLTENF